MELTLVTALLMAFTAGVGAGGLVFRLGMWVEARRAILEATRPARDADGR